MKKERKRHCCGLPFSDWFVTQKGRRYCWPCMKRETGGDYRANVLARYAENDRKDGEA